VRGLAIVAVLAGLSAPAFAESKAEALFKKGKKLLAEKQYSEACVLFEKSDKLDPGIGAKLNAAKCFEDWGKLARAYRWYESAEKMAKETKDDRVAQIRGLIDTLDPDVPRLTITLPAGADAVAAKVKLDGVALKTADIGTQMLVDPGPHQIEYRSDGKVRTKTVPLERGGASEITLELEASGGAEPKEPKEPKEPPSRQPEPIETNPGRTRRIVGLTLAGAGAVAVGVSVYLTLDARTTYKDALADHCSGSPNMCDPTGLEITRDARSRANTATVIAIIGGAATIGGVVLFLTAPKGAYIAPTAEKGGAGVVLGGRF
jgi:hypothetical protein